MVHACADGSPHHEQQTETKPAKPSQPDASPGQRPHTTVLTTTSERPRRSNCQQQAGNLQTGRTPRRRTKKRWDTSNTGGGEGPNEHVRGPSGIWKLRSAHPKSPNPDPAPDPVARSRAPSPGLDRISGGRRIGDGEISPRFGPGWVGGSRGAMASAQAPSSSAAPSRKEHLEAGKKRVCLFVACW